MEMLRRNTSLTSYNTSSHMLELMWMHNRIKFSGSHDLSGPTPRSKVDKQAETFREWGYSFYRVEVSYCSCSMAEFLSLVIV